MKVDISTDTSVRVFMMDDEEIILVARMDTPNDVIEQTIRTWHEASEKEFADSPFGTPQPWEHLVLREDSWELWSTANRSRPWAAGSIKTVRLT